MLGPEEGDEVYGAGMVQVVGEVSHAIVDGRGIADRTDAQSVKTREPLLDEHVESASHPGDDVGHAVRALRARVRAPRTGSVTRHAVR